MAAARVDTAANLRAGFIRQLPLDYLVIIIQI
jgi:hypothetical protein